MSNEKKESQFIEERVKDFQKKMLELKNADDFQEGGESGIYDFGYKMKFGDTIYTITDWKGMEKNFRQSLELQRERIVEKLKPCLDYCKQQNGLPYCKNCGLSDELIKEL